MRGPRPTLSRTAFVRAVALVWFAAWSQIPLAGQETSPRTRLTGEVYPIDVSVSATASLFHWLDSLAGLQDPGMSAGKTVEAHRRTFARLFGEPTARDTELLKRYGEIRRSFVRDRLDTPGPDAEDPSELLAAFLEAPGLEAALARVADLLEPGDYHDLQKILRHFAPMHERIWDDGRIPRRFLKHCRKQKRLDDLEALLGRVAAFFDVDPHDGPRPHLILTPVDDGFGTHAQANGHHLLIELRPHDRLHSTASVIVHENSHLLMFKMDPERRARLHAVARESGADGAQALMLLREALPTALGQGMAGRKFNPNEWTTSRRWYHRDRVDRYAKRIFPRISDAVAAGETLDAGLLRELIALYRTTLR